MPTFRHHDEPFWCAADRHLGARKPLRKLIQRERISPIFGAPMRPLMRPSMTPFHSPDNRFRHPKTNSPALLFASTYAQLSSLRMTRFPSLKTLLSTIAGVFRGTFIRCYRTPSCRQSCSPDTPNQHLYRHLSAGIRFIIQASLSPSECSLTRASEALKHAPPSSLTGLLQTPQFMPPLN